MSQYKTWPRNVNERTHTHARARIRTYASHTHTRARIVFKYAERQTDRRHGTRFLLLGLETSSDN